MLILDDQGSFNFIRSLIFIDELARAEITDVCISPGSRSTPLALAFYHHGEFNIHIIVDERSAAFFAMGIAKGSKLPVVLLCTSGTATANYFPAIIEADRTNIPLIIITADRPPKLRETDVNQTIDQIELYGNKVRYFKDILEPFSLDTNNPKIREYTNYLRETACNAVNFATRKYQNGPVHINFPFTKPLEPKSQELIFDLKKLHSENELYKGKEKNLQFVSTSSPKTEFSNSKIEVLIDHIAKSNRIVIICGPIDNEVGLPSKIINLSEHLNVPIIADVLSGIRLNAQENSKVITCINQLISTNIISKIHEPDLILHFGRNPISSSIEGYLDKLETTPKFQILPSTKWSKPIRMLDRNLEFDPIECIKLVIANIESTNQDINWTQSLIELNKRVLQLSEEYLKNGLEVDLIDRIIKNMHQEANLFLSNSLPIRYFDEFIYSSKIKLQIYGNRGASGIDGIVSTASGVAYATKRPTLLIIGDLALFHDLQGLLFLQNQEINLSILVINNSGGGIFRRLPISSFDSIYNDLFNTPIDFDIKKISTSFEIDYQLIKTSSDEVTKINSKIMANKNHVFEFKTNSIEFENFRQNTIHQINKLFSWSI